MNKTIPEFEELKVDEMREHLEGLKAPAPKRATKAAMTALYVAWLECAQVAPKGDSPPDAEYRTMATPPKEGVAPKTRVFAKAPKGVGRRDEVAGAIRGDTVLLDLLSAIKQVSGDQSNRRARRRTSALISKARRHLPPGVTLDEALSLVR